MNPDKSISVIVPVRNEESTIARAVRSLADQPEVLEILVVNDQSTDGTLALLQRLALSEPKLRLVESGPLAPGWVGKNQAAWRGAQQARGRWLLFTDADVTHLRGSAGKALAVAEAGALTMLSFSPRQEMHTGWERALIPFVFCRLSRLYPYAAVNHPQSPAAAANGQYLLVRSDAYRAIGGHAAVSGEVLEDVALARRAKEAGVPLGFLPGDQIASARMYASFTAMWEGWTKNLFPLVTVSGRTIRRELLSVFPWPSLLCFALAPMHPALGGLGAFLLAGRHVRYLGALRRNRFPISGVVYYVVAVALYCAALCASGWTYARGKVTWRGREYRTVAPAGQEVPAGDRTSDEWST
jgi:glycosyltransferase involved in cell wall biosynthesis